MHDIIDECWYSGRHEFCKATYPGQYEICSADYHRCVECTDDKHCPPERPWCDWDMECEECLVSTHCPTGESCLLRNGKWVCRVKDCVDYKEEGNYDFCANNFRDTPICDVGKRRCVECIVPADCEGERQTCIASKCVDESEMDCMQQIAAGFLNYCEVTFPERPVCHTQLRDCVECQFDNQCKGAVGEAKKTHWCSGTKCMIVEWECEGPEDCISDDYKCVKHECIKKDCSDYDDPDAHCAERLNEGWRCLDKLCVRCIVDEDCPEGKKCANNKCREKTCDEYKQPDLWCQKHFGESYECVGQECIAEIVEIKKGDCSEYVSTADADEYCASLDPKKPHCDFDTGHCHECNLPQHCPPPCICRSHSCYGCFDNADCDEYYRCSGSPDWECVREICTDQSDPDSWCRGRYGDWYVCFEDACRITDCRGVDTICPEGFYCPEHECIWGCRDKVNCPEAKPYCSSEGSCVECIGPVHCGMGYDCKDYVCVKKADCLKLDSLCPKNEYCAGDHCEEGCRDSENCGETTPHCSQNTGKCEECVFDKHCERGYDCDNYKCVWVGYDCSFDPECPENWFCSNGSCVFGCNLNDENCAKETPHCSQYTGKCEECWSDEHCDGGNYQKCEEYRCVARKDNAECVPGDKKHGKRCRDGIWVKIECKGPEDCLGHEYCDDGLCRDKERGCEVPSDCPFGYYCDFHESKLPEFHKCEKQVCRTHEECPVGMGCDINAFGPKERANVRTSCLSWREYHCSDEDPCPEEWVCDRGSGKCTEAICGEGRPCQDGRYECIDSECVPRRCEDRPDPQGYCMEEKGWYGRCVDGVCVVLDCGWYPDPDLMCQDTKGENWHCVDKRCIDFGAEGGSDPKQYCSETLGVDEAYWDFETRSCEVPDCDTVADPDKLCAQLKDSRYKCRTVHTRWGYKTECRRGQEGQECAVTEECVTGLRCADGICIEKECIRWQDCNDPEKWCNHGVCEPLRTECAGPEDCRDDYHCDAGGQCVPNACDDHYDCGEGECCSASKECVRCELVSCWYNFHCRRGWSCNTETNKCQRVGCTVDSECEEGYYCDLDEGICRKIIIGEECWKDSDCPEGQVCKGARGTKWVQDKSFLGSIRKKQPGLCVDKGTEIIRIEGTDDEKTCDYCRYMWTRIIKEGEGNLPPYHNKCRCIGVYED